MTETKPIEGVNTNSKVETSADQVLFEEIFLDTLNYEEITSSDSSEATFVWVIPTFSLLVIIILSRKGSTGHQ